MVLRKRKKCKTLFTNSWVHMDKFLVVVTKILLLVICTEVPYNTMCFEPPGWNQKLILKHLRLKSEWRANQRCDTISAAYLWQLKNHWRKKKERQLVDMGFWWEGLIKMFYNWIWWKWKWKSLVLSDSLQPHGLYGILQVRILEWVAFPFSRGSSWPKNWSGVSLIASGFFTNWAIRECGDGCLNLWMY